MGNDTQELTFGMKAVGLTFNPGGHPEVDAIKKICASLIDALHNSRQATESSDKKRMYSEAITFMRWIRKAMQDKTLIKIK